MAYERLPMRKITDVLRLKYASHLSAREIARSCSIARSTVAEYLRRAQAAGLSWPLPLNLSEADLEARLFPATPVSAALVQRPLPDCEHIYNELRSHKDVSLTRYQLWDEYRGAHPDGYEYSQYCELYRRWLGQRDYCMRQEHKVGEKFFVDYRKGPRIVNPETGELIETLLFVGVWGASNFTYAEASLTQTLPHWTGSHVRAFQYCGCAPHVLVPDCLKSGVTKACFYESEVNRSYAEMAEHYGCVIVPARPKHPRDKAKVEGGILIAVRWILAVLRHREFFSLAELNAEIAKLLEKLNTRPLRKLKKSRREVFESLDRPNALKLPDSHYEYAEWGHDTVERDYRITVEKHTYSVPFRLLRQRVDFRLTASTLEVFHKGERVAAHARSFVEHGDTYLQEHMPPAHQKYAGWTRDRVVQWGAEIGPSTALLVGTILESRLRLELGLSSCFGILKLAKKFGRDRLETASCRALKFNTCSYRSMNAILAGGLDRLPEVASGPSPLQPLLPFHKNVRGKEYYH
ncbi:MAG: IS21 family transposase [Pseudomonadota bacterium]